MLLIVVCVQTSYLANGVVGCPQAQPPICRDDEACGVYARVFIKLHITAQPGPVILVILCHSH